MKMIRICHPLTHLLHAILYTSAHPRCQKILLNIALQSVAEFSQIKTWNCAVTAVGIVELIAGDTGQGGLAILFPLMPLWCHEAVPIDT